MLGEVSIGSIRRDVARPANLAIVLTILVGIAVIVEQGAVTAVLVAISFSILSFALLFGVGRIGHLEQSVTQLRAEAVALWSLSPLGTAGGVLLPGLGGYAMSPQAAVALMAFVVRTQPSTIVELGPGSSTVLLTRLSPSLAKPLSITCLEHERQFVEDMELAFRYHDTMQVELVEAHLQPTQLPDWSGDWYDPAALEQLPSAIDLLVIDGPPERTGPDARFPAYPVLRHRLVDGALVFVDDTGREAERAMVQRWVTMGGLTIVQDGGLFMVLRKSAG